MNINIVNLRNISDIDAWLRNSNNVYIGRDSEWGNPFRLKNYSFCRQTVVDLYKAHVLSTPELAKKVGELRGKVLGCWCAPQLCHGEILHQLAGNRPVYNHQKSVNQIVMSSTEELRNLIMEVKNSMVTNEKFDELIKRIDEKDAKIAELEGKISVLEDQKKLFERRLDDFESYNRRQNLRIVGIPLPPEGVKESSEDVTEKVKEAIRALNVPDLDVDGVIDRAHRVGKRTTNATTGQSFHPVIVRFISWRARTAVYRKREKRGGTRIYTDLTKRRLDLKKLADERIRDNDGVKFAFADVNNNIGLRLANDQVRFFNSEEELVAILQSLPN